MVINEPVVQRLMILDSEGEPKYIEGTNSQRIKGRVSLKAGAGLAITQEDEALVIAIDTTSNVSDPVYQQKWTDIVKGNPPYSGVPYYVSAINKIKPRTDMPCFILSHLCSQMGVFEDPVPGDIEAVYPSPDEAAMELYDMCEACVDCEDYDKIFQYLEQIEKWVDINKDNNLVTGIQLFKQYQATVHYWNYLVHCQSLILRFYGSDKDALIKVGYRALGCEVLGDVRIGLKLYATNLPDTVELEKDWALIAVTSDPADLSVGVVELNPDEESSSESSGGEDHEGTPVSGTEVVISISQIAKGESVLVALSCTLAQHTHIGPLNEYVLEARWYNTHLGPEIVRSKRLTLPEPYYA